MKIEKIYVLFSLLYFFFLPHLVRIMYDVVWAGDLFFYLVDNFSIFRAAKLFYFLLTHVAIICFLISSLVLIKEKKLAINKFLLLAISIVTLQTYSFLLMIAIGTNVELIYYFQELDTSVLIFQLFNFCFFILTMIYFSFFRTPPVSNESGKKLVGRPARFINFVIDFLVIFSVTLIIIHAIRKGHIFEEIPLMNSSPYPFYALNAFLYYFIFEYLFSQTIGKFHNNAVVVTSEKRFKDILIRTLCRFIPFEAVSFLFGKGLHDSLSKTTVVK